MSWNAFELCSGCLKHLGKVRYTASRFLNTVIPTSLAMEYRSQATGASHASRGIIHALATQCQLLHVCL